MSGIHSCTIIHSVIMSTLTFLSVLADNALSNWPTKNEQGKPEVRQAVVFGLGSMFNHSSEPNVVWQRDLDRLIVVYTADRDIKEGEELCKLLLSQLPILVVDLRKGISYGSRLWFKDADAPKEINEGDGTEVLSKIQLV